MLKRIKSWWIKRKKAKEKNRIPKMRPMDIVANVEYYAAELNIKLSKEELHIIELKAEHMSEGAIKKRIDLIKDIRRKSPSVISERELIKASKKILLAKTYSEAEKIAIEFLKDVKKR